MTAVPAPQSDSVPELSVVIPTRGDSHCLELTLRALGRQTLPAHRFEVIVVRDGTDDVDYSGVAIAAKDLNLRLIELPEQGGRSVARNTGVQHATADVVVFLDADSYAEPQLLERHASHHAVPDSAPVLIGRRDELNLEDVEAVVAGAGTVPTARHVVGGGDIRFWKSSPEPGEWLQIGWMFAYTHNVSVHRSLVLAVGGFDQRFGRRWGVEDLELFYRIDQHLGTDRINFAYDDQAAVYHLPHYRNEGANVADLTENMALILSTHPHVDWEFVGWWNGFVVVERILEYRRVLADCVARSACRVGPVHERLAPSLPGTKVLWVGTGSADVALGEGALTFDYGAPRTDTNRHLLGTTPPAAPGELDAVVSVDFWRYLPWSELCQFVSSGCVSAGTVYLVSTMEELSARINPSDSTIDYLVRALSTRFDTVVESIEGLPFVLRLGFRDAESGPR
ncbi:glycosyltransferase family 2 protein [Micromonospora sp. NPDC047074]|uniref:glycosyltransferase n=1 Tax=Micromonospora sp. NPDC047074 TaxID=3154339 RepID=UPI0033EEEF30